MSQGQRDESGWIIIICQFLQQIIITIMHLALRQNHLPQKLSSITKNRPISKPQVPTDSESPSREFGDTQGEESFNVIVTDRRALDQPELRSIKKSMVNRSCINTISFCYQQLSAIPPQLGLKGESKLEHIQKLDLSFNRINDIHTVSFSNLTSLKQLLLNDNLISELPFSEINQCKGLKYINLNNNKLYILPTLYKVAYIEARSNPLRLVTSQLVRLPQLEFVTIDWTDYLIDCDINPMEDKFKNYCELFNRFKRDILEKIDYEKEENTNYCDFHCYFNIRLQSSSIQFISGLISRALYREDPFFISYLHDFQNELDYPSLNHNYKLLLETALDSNNKQVLELFRLKKEHYIQGSPQLYFESLRLACYHSNWDIFEYLIKVKNHKRRISNKQHLTILLQDVVEKFDKEKQSDKILLELVKLYKETTDKKVMINIPEQYHSKVFRSMSTALLEIYTNNELKPYFQMHASQASSAPLFFAMKSKNEELLKQMIKEGRDIFEHREGGHSCKFTYGSTQVSRKMIWRRQKQLIKKHWDEYSNLPEDTTFKSYNHSLSEKKPNHSKILTQENEVAEQFELMVGNNHSAVVPASARRGKAKQQKPRKCMVQDQILPFLFLRAKQLTTCSWAKEYSKKMVKLASFISYLQELLKYKDNSLLKRLELWKKIMERLGYLFDTLEGETPLLQYELVHIAQLLSATKEDRYFSEIKIQSQKVGIKGDSFWCCRNVVNDDGGSFQ